MFIIGVLLSDVDNIKPVRPFDIVRKWNIWWSILRNFVLIVIFLTCGSYVGEKECQALRGGNCIFWEYATMDFTIPHELFGYLGAVAIVLLALVSEAF